MTGSMTGSMVGGIIGAAVAQQEGVMIGSVVGSILGQLLPSPANVVSDLLGDLGADGVKQTTAYLWSRIKTTEKQAIHDHLQAAWQNAFQEAIYDIGGKACFPDVWRKRTRKLDEAEEYHLEYPYSLLRDHHQRPDLAEKVCACLQQLAQMAAKSLPIVASDPTLYFANLPDLENVAEKFVETAVLSHVKGGWLAELSAVGDGQLFDLEAHLRHAFFSRLLAHLGENLQQQPEVWRAFNRLMWQCLKLELDQLVQGQTTIQEQWATWQQAGNVETLSEQMAQVLTAVGQAQHSQDERLDDLIARLVAERQILLEHISDEHRKTRAEVRQMVDQAVQVIASRLPMGDGLDEATLKNITRRYQELLADQLRYRRFQGIAQFQKAIRLPLADFYLELGLLRWQDEKEEREHQELPQAPYYREYNPGKDEKSERERQMQLLTNNEVGRLRLLESRLEERATDGLRNSPKLVILGEPGAGKTMTLHFLALMLAQGQGVSRLDLPQPYLPILVRLADYARAGHIDQSLDSFLRQHVAQNYGVERLSDVLRRALDQGVCLVLLDGLDEIGTEPVEGQLLRLKMLERIQQFADQWCSEQRLNRLILTSRKEGYRREDLVGFAHVELSPLRPPDEIKTFLHRWYMAYEQAHDDQINQEQAKARAEEAVADILPQILRWDSVRYLATNPLMLTILVLVYENVGQLPDRRAKLYEICAQTLIQSWRQIQTRKSPTLLAQISANQIFSVMGWLAYWLHENRPGGTATFSEWELQLVEALRAQGTSVDVKKLAAQFLHYARHEAGLLAERGLGQIGFFHLTFEEYLAGYAIAHAENFSEQQAMVQAHWEDPRWREVILLAVGEAAVCAKTPPVTNHLFWTLLNLEAANEANRGREIVLAGRALLDVGIENIAAKTAVDIQRKLRETMQNRDPETGKLRYTLDIWPSIRAEAGEVLDRLGWLPEDLNDWIFCEGCADDGGNLWAARYPVTNAQFSLFIEAGGYDNSDYWESHFIPINQARGEPNYWNDVRVGKERRSYPTVGVSWYEATAYANWLTDLLRRASKQTSKLLRQEMSLVADLFAAGVTTVRLPTVREWVRLAGGEDDNRYPWDKRGHSTTPTNSEVVIRSNISASGIHNTSPVAMYPQGASEPFGLAEITGNVWEWTADESSSGRAVRGGSWTSDVWTSRVSERVDYAPIVTHGDIGFRLVAPSLVPDSSLSELWAG